MFNSFSSLLTVKMHFFPFLLFPTVLNHNHLLFNVAVNHEYQSNSTSKRFFLTNLKDYDFKKLSFLIIVFLSILHISEYDTPIPMNCKNVSLNCKLYCINCRLTVCDSAWWTCFKYWNRIWYHIEVNNPTIICGQIWIK